MTGHITIQYVENLLASRNIMWINKERGCTSKRNRLKLKCLKEGCNYEWETEFRSVENTKNGCPKCSRKVKYTIDFVRLIYSNNNISLLSKKYKDTNSKLNLHCNICNHEWNATFSDLYNGHKKCARCAKNLKHNIGFVRSICAKKNIIVLSNKYININSPMNFMCTICKYKWKTNFDGIYNSDNGCPKCSGCLKYNMKFVKNYSIGKNITILSSKYKNRSSMLDCLCNKCNHKWKTNFAGIKCRNQGCPECASFKTEKLCRIYLENKYHLLFPKASPKWLNGLQLDGYCNRLKLAFEYNGIQHYKFFPLFHKTKEDFKNQQNRDILKNKLCVKNKIKLINIPYTYNSSKETKLYKFIDDELIKLGFI
jgi:hypothetical protein